MARAFFEYLSDQGLLGDDMEARIDDMSADQLDRLIQDGSALVPERPTGNSSRFQFVASASMAGSSHPCAAPRCRRNKVVELSLLSSLYADRVLVPRPFHEFEGDDSLEWSIDQQLGLIYTLQNLRYLRPLFDAGLMEFVSETHFCIGCYSKKLGGVGTEDHLRTLRNRLDDLYASELSYKIKKVYGEVVLEVKGSTDLIDHGSSYSPLKTARKLKLGRKLEKVLSKEEVLSESFQIRFTEVLFHDFLSLIWHAKSNGTSLISSINIHEILSFRADSSKDPSYLPVTPYPSHKLPIVKGANLERLIEMRFLETEAFDVYRDALASMMRSRDLSFDQLMAVYESDVMPEIHNLDHKIKGHRKMLADSVRENLLFGCGFLSVGLFSGALHAEVVGLFTAIAGSPHLSNLISSSNALLKPPEHLIADEKYFFAWKVASDLSPR